MYSYLKIYYNLFVPLCVMYMGQAVKKKLQDIYGALSALRNIQSKGIRNHYNNFFPWLFMTYRGRFVDLLRYEDIIASNSGH